MLSIQDASEADYGAGSDEEFGGRLARARAPAGAAHRAGPGFVLTEDFVHQRQLALPTNIDAAAPRGYRRYPDSRTAGGAAGRQPGSHRAGQKRARWDGQGSEHGSSEEGGSYNEGLVGEELSALQVRGYACELFKHDPSAGPPPSEVLGPVPLPPWTHCTGLADRFDARLHLSAQPRRRSNQDGRAAAEWPWDWDLPSPSVRAAVQAERWRSLRLHAAAAALRAATNDTTQQGSEEERAASMSQAPQPSAADAPRAPSDPPTRLRIPFGHALPEPVCALLRAKHLPVARYKLIEATARRVSASQQLEVMVRLHQSANPAFSFLAEGDAWHPLYAALRDRASSSGAVELDWPEPQEVTVEEVLEGGSVAAKHTSRLPGLCDYDSDASSSASEAEEASEEGRKEIGVAEHAPAPTTPALPVVPPPQPLLQVAELLAARAAAAPAGVGAGLLATVAAKEATNPRFAFMQTWSPHYGWWLSKLAEAGYTSGSGEATAAAAQAPAAAPPPATEPQRSTPDDDKIVKCEVVPAPVPAPVAVPPTVQARPSPLPAAAPPVTKAAGPNRSHVEQSERTYITEWVVEEDEQQQRYHHSGGGEAPAAVVGSDEDRGGGADDEDARIDGSGLCVFDDEAARAAFYAEMGGQAAGVGASVVPHAPSSPLRREEESRDAHERRPPLPAPLVPTEVLRAAPDLPVTAPAALPTNAAAALSASRFQRPQRPQPLPGHSFPPLRDAAASGQLPGHLLRSTFSAPPPPPRALANDPRFQDDDSD